MSDAQPIPDPRAGRFEPLILGSRIAVGVALVLAVVGVAAPEPLSDWSAVASIVVVMVAPLLRVGWLAVRWFRRGDRRFGWVAVGVLCVVATAVVLASL
ncbi:hypothetical protein [Dermatobacter hominis]|uniref:hypothetical protein n=1 Tax=Dermatobacter hominis TaxID=2884263 RepID=UPI001D108896|nr:hypothetical protein [Dermatobacter hominis]UDY36429.1 hypothetical protein LH044_02575 [Dermatobacter hominis]